MGTINIYIMVYVLVGVIRNCDSFATGAPVDACNSLLPIHGSSAQGSSPPYEIIVSPTSYTNGTVVTVTLTASPGIRFRGYIMQMRRVDNSFPVSGFSVVAGGQLLFCNNQANNGVTHTENSDKTCVTFHWTAPEDLAGQIQIVATVVQTQPVFWTNVRSAELTVADQNSTVTGNGEQYSNTTCSDIGNYGTQNSVNFQVLLFVILIFLSC